MLHYAAGTTVRVRVEMNEAAPSHNASLAQHNHDGVRVDVG